MQKNSSFTWVIRSEWLFRVHYQMSVSCKLGKALKNILTTNFHWCDLWLFLDIKGGGKSSQYPLDIFSCCYLYNGGVCYMYCTLCTYNNSHISVSYRLSMLRIVFQLFVPEIIGKPQKKIFFLMVPLWRRGWVKAVPLWKKKLFFNVFFPTAKFRLLLKKKKKWASLNP